MKFCLFRKKENKKFLSLCRFKVLYECKKGTFWKKIILKSLKRKLLGKNHTKIEKRELLGKKSY